MLASFGPFSFDLESLEITKAGIRQRLEDKPALALRHLINHAGTLVTREELQGALWPAGVHVDFDHGLNKAINRLRTVLGDSRQQPRYIETLSRKGYRFIAQLEFCPLHTDADQSESAVAITTPDNAQPQSPAATVQMPVWPFVPRRLVVVALVLFGVLLSTAVIFFGSKKPDRKPEVKPQAQRLVVLPFLNLTGDLTQEYFCDGLTDELIAQLSSLNPEKLQVIGRASAMHYKGSSLTAAEIGAELKSNYVLGGSVRRVGPLYRITIQLTDAQSQTNVWTGGFDRRFQDVLDVHRDVALAVGHEIGERISPQFQHPAFGTQPIDPVAHDAYLRGRFYWNKRTVTDLRDSIDEFKRAIAIAPDYSEAHAGLADAYSLLASYGAIPFREGYPKARAEAQRALQLKPDSAEARTSLAFVEAYHDWRFDQAEKDFRAAIRDNPNYVTAHHWFGLFLSQRGRYEEALSHLRNAAELDPFRLTIGIDLGNAYVSAGRYEEAEHELLRVRALDSNYYGTYGAMTWLYALRGRLPEAERENEMLKKLSGNYFGDDHILAYAYAKVGRTNRARDILQHISKMAREHGARPPCPMDAYIALHEDAAALNCLDEWIKERADWLVPLEYDPEFSRIASDPRFQERLQRAGLVPASGATGATGGGQGRG